VVLEVDTALLLGQGADDPLLVSPVEAYFGSDV
jgi:hypothetical protein